MFSLKYQPLKIILFGSAGRGEYDRVNDLDFLIIKDHVPARSIDRMLELETLIDRNTATDMLVTGLMKLIEACSWAIRL